MPHTLTDAQRDALTALALAGGEGVVDRHGGVIAAGDRLGVDPTTWLRLFTTGHLESRGDMRLGLTDLGRAVEPRTYRHDHRFIRGSDQPRERHEGAE